MPVIEEMPVIINPPQFFDSDHPAVDFVVHCYALSLEEAIEHHREHPKPYFSYMIIGEQKFYRNYYY